MVSLPFGLLGEKMKQAWIVYMVLMNYLIQIVVFFGVGVLVAEWLDSTWLGLGAAVLAYVTRLMAIPVLLVNAPLIMLPNLLFLKLGWLNEEDLS